MLNFHLEFTWWNMIQLWYLAILKTIQSNVFFKYHTPMPIFCSLSNNYTTLKIKMQFQYFTLLIYRTFQIIWRNLKSYITYLIFFLKKCVQKQRDHPYLLVEFHDGPMDGWHDFSPLHSQLWPWTDISHMEPKITQLLFLLLGL